MKDNLCANCKWYRYVAATYWDPSDEWCEHPDCDCTDENGEPVKSCEFFEHSALEPDVTLVPHLIGDYTNVKPYSDFTEEEREKHQEIWGRHIDVYCPVLDEETQNRPCDMGCLCDRCQYDYYLNLEVTRARIKEGLPITPDVQTKYAREEF